MDNHSRFVIKAPEESPALEDATVHVWLASLRLKAPRLLEMWRTLTPAECERALRFRFQRDCDSFIAARGLLRTLLGNYLRLSPPQIKLCYNAYGKPALPHDGGAAHIHFNLSHSSGYALFAFGRGRRLGVDIERVRPDFTPEDIAERFFSPSEMKALRELPEHLRRKAFFDCWTRKEAYIKARGEGLSLPLDQFDVSLSPDEPATLRAVNGSSAEAAKWSLCELLSGPDYVAALAVEGHDWQLKRWQWNKGE